jgi:hypothetical protein
LLIVIWFFDIDYVIVCADVCLLVYKLELEAHHKISRKLKKFGSNNDAGPSSSLFLLPADPTQTSKRGDEPTSLLEFLEYVYGPLLLRALLPDSLYPPTYSITFPSFHAAKYTREMRRTGTYSSEICSRMNNRFSFSRKIGYYRICCR